MLKLELSPQEVKELILSIEDVEFDDNTEVLQNALEKIINLTKEKEFLDYIIEDIIIKNKTYNALDGKTVDEAINFWSPSKDYRQRNEYIIKKLVELNYLMPDSNWILRARKDD